MSKAHAMLHLPRRRQLLQWAIASLPLASIGRAGANGANAAAPSPPPWVPVRGGELTVLRTQNSFLSQNAQLAGWAHAFGKIVDDFSGGVLNPYWGALGAMVFHGGGHAATFDNSVVILDLNDLSFKRLSQPTFGNDGANWVNLNDRQRPRETAFDARYCEYGDGQPGAGHTYDTLAILPPAAGGAACGSLIRVCSLAVHVNLSCDTGWAHRFDFSSTALRDGQWVRWSANGASGPVYPGACSAYDPLRQRIWWLSGLSSGPGFIRYLDVRTQQQRQIAYASGAAGAPPLGPDSATLRYDAKRDCLVMSGVLRGAAILAWLPCEQPQQGWVLPALSIPIPVAGGAALPFDHVPQLDQWVLLSPADKSAVYEVRLPERRSTSWSVVRQPIHGGVLESAYVAGKRWSYVDAVKAFVWMASSSSAIAVYRPWRV